MGLGDGTIVTTHTVRIARRCETDQGLNCGEGDQQSERGLQRHIESSIGMVEASQPSSSGEIRK